MIRRAGVRYICCASLTCATDKREVQVFLLQRGALASVIPMPKVELDSPAQNAVGGASRKSSVVSKSASGVAKKKSVDGDYKKRRKQPLSEEAKAKRRDAALQAAVTRKKNAIIMTHPRKTWRPKYMQ